MNLPPPPRDALLDVAWLTRTHATEGYDALLRQVRRGAETYDGPVTAIAEAVLDLRWGIGDRLLDAIDLGHALAHALATGSWSSNPTGVRTLGSCSRWLAPALSEDKREKFRARSAPCHPPPWPDLHHLRLVPPLDAAWVGHTGGIWGCDVSPDGSHVVSASRDGHVAVWHTGSRALVARGHAGGDVRDCAVTADGRRVVSANSAGDVAVWDLRTMALLGEAKVPFEEPSDSYNPVKSGKPSGSPRRWRRFAVSPDGTRLAVASSSAVDVWDLDRFEPVATLKIENDSSGGMLALFFGSNDTLVTITRGHPLPVLTWDLHSRRVTERATLTMPHMRDVQRAIVTRDHRTVIAVGGRDTIVWRIDSPAPVAHVPHGASGQAVTVSSDGTLAATSGSSDTTQELTYELLRLWSLPDLRELHRWRLRDFGCRDIACALTFASDNRHLVVAGWEGVLRRVVLPIA